MYICISIGNSDNNLTQEEWSQFCSGVAETVRFYATRVHGEFYSLPNSKFQNACWLLEVVTSGSPTYSILVELRKELTRLRKHYSQDSIFYLWNTNANVEFL